MRTFQRLVHMPLSIWATLLVLLVASGAAGQENVERHTRHYDLYIDLQNGENVDDICRSLEVLYSDLKRFWGKEPHERLRVKVLSNEDRFKRVRDADGASNGKEVGTKGFYAPVNHTVYVHSLFSGASGREALFHECTHQFHFLACTGNKMPQSRYYVEGVAEFLGMRILSEEEGGHGILSEMPWPDLPAGAKRDFVARHASSIRALATDTQAFDDRDVTCYGAAWGLVAFLCMERHDDYIKWSTMLDQGEDASLAWDQSFGQTPGNSVDQRYRQFLDDHHVRWEVVHGAWSRADKQTITAVDRGACAVSIYKQPLASLSASVRVDESGYSGVVVDFAPDVSYKVVQVMPSGTVAVWTRGSVGWESNVTVAGCHVDNPRRFDISIASGPSMVLVSINHGNPVRIPVVNPRVGLSVTDGAATFGSIKMK